MNMSSDGVAEERCLVAWLFEEGSLQLVGTEAASPTRRLPKSLCDLHSDNLPCHIYFHTSTCLSLYIHVQMWI